MHPTQLYSLIDGLLLLFFLWAFEPYKRRDGELTALVLTIHPIMRFLLEIIRTDELPVFNTGLSISQNISIGIFIAGIGLWIYLLRRPLRIEWPRSRGAAIRLMSVAPHRCIRQGELTSPAGRRTIRVESRRLWLVGPRIVRLGRGPWDGTFDLSRASNRMERL